MIGTQTDTEAERFSHELTIDKPVLEIAETAKPKPNQLLEISGRYNLIVGILLILVVVLGAISFYLTLKLRLCSL